MMPSPGRGSLKRSATVAEGLEDPEDEEPITLSKPAANRGAGTFFGPKVLDKSRTFELRVGRTANFGRQASLDPYDERLNMIKEQYRGPSRAARLAARIQKHREIQDAAFQARRLRALRILDNPLFEALVFLAIFMNAVWMGIDTTNLEVEDSAGGGDGGEPARPGYFILIDTLFILVFLAELLVRIQTYKKFAFFWDCPVMKWWNRIESILLLLYFVDAYAPPDTLDGVKGLSVLRLGRVTRLGKLLRIVPGFDIILVTMTEGLTHMFAALCVLLLCVYAGAMLLTIWYYQVMSSNLREEFASLCGSLSASMFTTFRMLTLSDGGISAMQQIVANTSEHISGVEQFTLLSFSLAYMSCSGLTILNILVGIYVDVVDTIRKKEEDLDILEQCIDVFHLCDAKGIGKITKRDFEELMRYEKKGLQGIDVDLHLLLLGFELLELEEMNLPQFLKICFKLLHPAESMELLSVQKNVQTALELLLQNKREMEELRAVGAGGGAGASFGAAGGVGSSLKPAAGHARGPQHARAGVSSPAVRTSSPFLAAVNMDKAKAKGNKAASSTSSTSSAPSGERAMHSMAETQLYKRIVKLRRAKQEHMQASEKRDAELLFMDCMESEDPELFVKARDDYNPDDVINNPFTSPVASERTAPMADQLADHRGGKPVDFKNRRGRDGAGKKILKKAAKLAKAAGIIAKKGGKKKGDEDVVVADDAAAADDAARSQGAVAGSGGGGDRGDRDAGAAAKDAKDGDGKNKVPPPQVAGGAPPGGKDDNKGVVKDADEEIPEQEENDDKKEKVAPPQQLLGKPNEEEPVMPSKDKPQPLTPANVKQLPAKKIPPPIHGDSDGNSDPISPLDDPNSKINNKHPDAGPFQGLPPADPLAGLDDAEQGPKKKGKRSRKPETAIPPKVINQYTPLRERKAVDERTQVLEAGVIGGSPQDDVESPQEDGLSPMQIDLSYNSPGMEGGAIAPGGLTSPVGALVKSSLDQTKKT